MPLGAAAAGAAGGVVAADADSELVYLIDQRYTMSMSMPRGKRRPRLNARQDQW